MSAPSDREVTFDENDLFFSKTDGRGRILSCNDVFLSVAGYEAQEIIGAPHRIIRHPDMPRSVFRLLWSELLAGKPIGAYVKNLAKTGEYYWVFALAVPVKDGFLSIRLKATSERQQLIEDLYKRMLAAEAAHGKNIEMAIDAGTEVLHQALKSHGVENYENFCSSSLRLEFASRAELLAQRGIQTIVLPEARSIVGAYHHLPLMDGLVSEAETSVEHFDGVSLETHRIALNSAIAAAKMSESGAALGVLSSQIASLAQEISEESDALGAARATLLPSCASMTFQVALAALATEMITASRSATEVNGPMTEDEQRARYGDTLKGLEGSLQEVLGIARRRAIDGAQSLRRSLRGFDEISTRLRRHLMTTRIGQVTGRAISAGIPGAEEYTELLKEFAKAGESGTERVDALQISTMALEQAVQSWRSFSA